ncbi:MAG: DUF1328 domain-containing protein [Sphingomonadales bacterium]|nr:DUF1328 domain-containing protein [Sphingomonadales bacterium]
MFKLALASLGIGLILALLGFGGLGGSFVDAARILFYFAVAFFLFFLVLHIGGRSRGGRGGGMGGPNDPL